MHTQHPHRVGLSLLEMKLIGFLYEVSLFFLLLPDLLMSDVSLGSTLFYTQLTGFVLFLEQ